LLTQYIDWRAVFLINVPLAAITIALTLLYTRAGGHSGAIVCWLLVRKADHEVPTHIFFLRSRWTWATTGETPGPTRNTASGRNRSDGQPPPERRAE
jgi:hypothetical protein